MEADMGKAAEKIKANQKRVKATAQQPATTKPPPTTRSAQQLEPYQPFPVDALPTPLDRFVSKAASALGCDEAYIALPVLAVVASAIGNTRTIRLKRGWTEPSVVWAVVVGDSGTLKSPAHLKATERVFQIQEASLREYRQA